MGLERKTAESSTMQRLSMMYTSEPMTVPGVPCIARFAKKFKKKFNAKSDDHIDVYLGTSR